MQSGIKCMGLNVSGEGLLPLESLRLLEAFSLFFVLVKLCPGPAGARIPCRGKGEEESFSSFRKSYLLDARTSVA